MQRRAKKLHCGLVETYGGLLTEIDQKLQQGVDVPKCLARALVECRENEDLDDLGAAMLVSAFMIGGVETVCIYLHRPISAPFLIHNFGIDRRHNAMVLRNHPSIPEIQEKAQAELDRVVGRERLPNNDDEQRSRTFQEPVMAEHPPCNQRGLRLRRPVHP